MVNKYNQFVSKVLEQIVDVRSFLLFWYFCYQPILSVYSYGISNVIRPRIYVGYAFSFRLCRSWKIILCSPYCPSYIMAYWIITSFIQCTFSLLSFGFFIHLYSFETYWWQRKVKFYLLVFLRSVVVWFNPKKKNRWKTLNQWNIEGPDIKWVKGWILKKKLYRQDLFTQRNKRFLY